MRTADLGNGIEYEQDVLAIGTDSVLLANFALPVKGRVCDLGCGAGAVMLLMALREEKASYDGVEIRADAAEKAGRNIVRAGLSQRMQVRHLDLRQAREHLEHAAYQVVVSNPPYAPVGGSVPPDDDGARIARTEECCTLAELCATASYLLQFGGRFCVVYPPERLTALMCTMRDYDIEPKRLRLYCRKADAPPSLALLEGRRGGKEGLTILPSLFGDSEEFRQISRTF